MKKLLFFIIVLFATPFLFLLFLKFYIPIHTKNRFGDDVVYFTDKAGAFSPSGSVGPRIWCTRNFQDIPMRSILTRAGLIFLELDWTGGGENEIPIYFGVINEAGEVYMWSFRKMDYDDDTHYSESDPYFYGHNGFYLNLVVGRVYECKETLK